MTAPARFPRYGDTASMDDSHTRLVRPASGPAEADDAEEYSDASLELDGFLDHPDECASTSARMQPDEFTCRSCHLVMHVSRSGGGGYCHDCA